MSGTGPTTGINPSIFQFSANPATDIFRSDLAPAGNAPVMVAMSPDGGSAYVTNESDRTISQYDVDAATGQLVPKATSTITVGGRALISCGRASCS
jgi:DNA-binding beta-propeller fold protein YncE